MRIDFFDQWYEPPSFTIMNLVSPRNLPHLLARAVSHLVARAIGAIALLLLSSYAVAQYPSKPITLIVPFPAGTASDLVTRIIANDLTASLGQPVIVSNRPGANSAIG